MTTPITDDNTVVSADSIHAENLSIGGNINQHYYGNDRTRLVPVQFGPADDVFLPPNYADTLFNQVQEKRIVFISGDEVINKSDVVRFIARELLESEAFSDLEIAELLRENENQDKRTSIMDLMHHERCNSKIVLLYDLHPERIDYNFERLLHLAQEKSCIFLITVNASLDVWQKAGKIVGEYWFEIPKGRHYSETQLCDFFLQELIKQPPAFLENVVEDMTPDFMLSPTLRVNTIISRFFTLDQVQLFLNHYQRLSERPSDFKLTELTNLFCQGQAQLVRSWFYQLTHQEKVLALSASLFDGLLIDQYLEALHTITDTTFWETSDSSLKAIDYFNLSFLDAFFQVRIRNGQHYLVSRSPSTKEALIEIGKAEYRRHFKTALAEFQKITRLSYSTKALNWELFGTSAKRVWIRKAFTETLRVTGTIEYALVENHLLELAASGNQYLQNIGAKAMAQWRLTNQEDLLFSTLRTWQRDEEIQERIEELFARNPQRSDTQKVKAIDLIKITAIMTLGQASYYDQPNRLHEEIIQAMVEFSKDDSWMVIKSMRSALPKFIHHHSLQLQRTLFEELMPEENLRDAIVDGLLLALGDYPQEVSLALKNWFDSCMGDASKANRRNATTNRDNQLIVLLNVLERADLRSLDTFPLDELYTRFLIPLLLQEERTIVIEQVIRLLAQVQSYDYTLASRHANKTIGRMNRSNRMKLVEYWGSVYRDQRLEMAGSDSYQRDNQWYPVWTGNQSRPLTTLEKALYQWMEADDTQRRFATLVFLELGRSFDRFERHELQQQATLRHQQMIWEQHQTRTTTRPVPVAPAEIRLHLFLRIRIFFYFLFSSNENKYLLKDTILLFLNVHRYSSADLELLINRWQRSEQKGVTNKLAKWLKRFF